jgi:hypothetical protein
MQFIYPGFLFALSVLAIPLIIHLFNFRKFKRIYFTNVKFLKEIKLETQSKSQLKHILVLISRMLALLFLVLAFAQPILPVSKKMNVSGNKQISLFVDNSFSMDALGKHGNLLDEAKKNAKEIVAAYKPSDRFQLLTNDFEAKHQRWLTKEEFLENLQEVKSSAAVKSISEIATRQQDLLNASESKNKTSYLISDFQKSNFKFSELKNDTNINYFLVPVVGSTINNIYIDSCWFESPSRQLNKAEILYLKISNLSNEAIENAPIKLFLNKQQKALASFSLEANSSSTVQLTFTCKESGIQNASLQINDYPISFDDTYYFSFELASKINVLGIHSEEENKALQNLFQNDSTFNWTAVSEKNIDYGALSKNNLIVLNELPSISTGLASELKRFIQNGGSVLTFPGTEIDANSYQNFLSSILVNNLNTLDTTNTRVDKINYLHPIYNDVFDNNKKKNENIDMPVVLNHYPIRATTRSNFEYLMRMQNGNIFIGENKFEKGTHFLSAVPLDSKFSNFSKHALFVPTLYKIALNSLASPKLFYTLGKDEPISIPSKTMAADEIYHLKNTAENYDMVPEHKTSESGTKLFLHKQLMQADNYMLYAGKENICGLSFNFDRKESNLSSWSEDELEKEINQQNLSNFSLLSENVKDLTGAVLDLNQGKKYWKWCIVLALLFLAVEVALLRFWK